MTGLASLAATAGPVSLPYCDPAFPHRPMTLHAARPASWHPAMPVLFVHHGVTRNGRDYRDYWMPHVDRGGFLAIAVEFPHAAFPEHLWYNFGNLRAADGSANPRRDWTFGVDDRLFAALRDQGLTTAPRYGLFGHSAGGQFVHRMLSFGYRQHVAVAVTANAGTYAMPDLSIDWPWGLGGDGPDCGGPAGAAAIPAHRHGRHRGHQDDGTLFSRRTEIAAAGADAACPRPQLLAPDGRPLPRSASTWRGR